MDRLKPIIEREPKGTWEDWIMKAYLKRISLSAVGYYATPDIGYDISKNIRIMYDYFTYGVACTEVEVDCLTGDHHVIRTDIVMDVGKHMSYA